MAVTSWRSESSNMSLVILDKLLFRCRSCSLLEKLMKQYQFSHIRQVEICRKKFIVDGDDKIESLLDTDNMSSIDGADYFLQSIKV